MCRRVGLDGSLRHYRGVIALAATRSSLQLLRVARTIADLNDTASVDRNAVAQASCFRCTDLLKQPGVQ